MMVNNKLRTAFFLLLSFLLAYSANAGIEDFFDKEIVKEKIHKKISNLDVNFSTGLGNLDIFEGANIAAKYRFDVEASYQDHFYTRVDRWDLKAKINVGDVIEDTINLPFSFSINRKSSFVFVRQFKDKKEAIKATPYTPKKLPLNAELALRNLSVGDFVSIPANLNIVAEENASSATVAPVILSATAKIFYLLSGEFNIQVYKIDESHVRLKMITSRGYSSGASSGGEISFKFFGIKVIDNQLDHLFDRDLVKLDRTISPGARFIVDYIFDLNNEEAKEAYNQILNSTFKFKDVVVLNKLRKAGELKDKLISSYEKAEKLFAEDSKLPINERRVSRIFKGFDNSTEKSKKLKIALLLASFKKERAYTENNITFIDKNEKNLDFLYPTSTKYTESKLGRWIFDLKDQSFQTKFGLIPRLPNGAKNFKNPDYGLAFERRDKYFSENEQMYVGKFIIDQIPEKISMDINFGEWVNGKIKTDARIFLQLILKADGFDYLKEYSKEEIKKRLIAYIYQKGIFDENNQSFTKAKKINKLAEAIFQALQNEENDKQEMTKNIVKLNEHDLFEKIGTGFLISLLPEDQLKELIYLKIEMIAPKVAPLYFEFGTLKYKALLNELNIIHSRIANRTYDLRVTNQDLEMEEENSKLRL